MKVERKYIDLKSLKVRDTGSGEIEGHRAVFSTLDEGGDIILPGAFKDTIDEFLSSGFTAESHDWDFSKAVGFPVEAREDAIGFFVRSQFHSTPDAQAVRTKARERMDAGKRVGFSFGYSADEYEVIQAGDYKTKLTQYLRPDRLNVDMLKATRFSQVRLLKRVTVIEDSLVTSPMNKLAGATGVKGYRMHDLSRLKFERARLRARAVLALCDLDASDPIITRARAAIARGRKALPR
jgi:HK97 family phage prohead protease